MGIRKIVMKKYRKLFYVTIRKIKHIKKDVEKKVEDRKEKIYIIL